MQMATAIYAGLLLVIVVLGWIGWPRPAISPAGQRQRLGKASI
jgi:hypothetical protein